LSQNFSFWESFLGFRGKSGLPAAFSMSLAQNRALLAHSQLVLGQAQVSRIKSKRFCPDIPS
ncbi:MAG: hypothetical protein LBP93_09745, partial [Treponema sp.]|nr:hypothetical protein [Treponema sp.]